MFDTYFPLADLFEAYVASNATGRTIVIVQIVGSICVWSVMLGKWLDLSTTMAVARDFRRFFTKSTSLLAYHFQRVKVSNPVIRVYTAASESLVRQLSVGNAATPVASVADAECRTLSPSSLALVKGVAEESLSDEIIKLDDYMNIVAFGASLAPLVGLLGTVWGILDAFQTMGIKGSALLSEVAPGLSSALLTTVMGLLVAIPSAIGYNLLLGRIRKISSTLDGFTDEYLARLSAEFGRDCK